MVNFFEILCEKCGLQAKKEGKNLGCRKISFFIHIKLVDSNIRNFRRQAYGRRRWQKLLLCHFISCSI